MKEVWSGGVGGSLVMVQDETEVSGLTEEEEAFVRSWTTVLSAVFASQLGAVLFGVAYVGGDSGHVPGGEDTISGWRDTGSAQHYAGARDLGGARSPVRMSRARGGHSGVWHGSR